MVEYNINRKIKVGIVKSYNYFTGEIVDSLGKRYIFTMLCVLEPIKIGDKVSFFVEKENKAAHIQKLRIQLVEKRNNENQNKTRK